MQGSVMTNGIVFPLDQAAECALALDNPTNLSGMKQLVRAVHRSDVCTFEPCLRVTLLCKLNGQACETGAPEGVSRIMGAGHAGARRHVTVAGGPGRHGAKRAKART